MLSYLLLVGNSGLLFDFLGLFEDLEVLVVLRVCLVGRLFIWCEGGVIFELKKFFLFLKYFLGRG